MASIQRIAANANQVIPEVNFALFDTNLDFSLWKCNVPAELVPLGERFSKRWRELAEDGSLHILARPYGTRASEIVHELDAGTPPESIAGGIFGPHLGVDSTSIWAGATSGSSALLMHLLSSTAIWVELIDYRRQIVKDQGPENDKTSNFFARQAAVYETEWSAIQGWDASARAWLQIADNSSRKRQQKQIELIANNLSVAVQTQVTSDGVVTLSAPRKDSVYDSVIHNFCRALSTMEHLIVGRPQRILNGGNLLGLTSWHLYPDLVILGPKTQEVFQKYALVANSGIATLSIAYQDDPHGNQDGRKQSSLHDSKLTFSELQALILGAYLDSVDPLPIAADILNSLILRDIKTGPGSLDPDPTMYQDTIMKDVMATLHLLYPLIRGVNLLSSDIEEEQKVALQLIRYGANSAKAWIGNSNTMATPFFGITDPTFAIQHDHTPKGRVRVLRTLCEPPLSEPDAFTIRFKRGDTSWAYAPIVQKQGPVGGKRSRSEFESETLEDKHGLRRSEDENWVFLVSKYDHVDPLSASSNDYNLELLQRTPLPTVPLSVVRGLVNTGSLDLEKTLDCINNSFATSRPHHRSSLLALGRIIDHYKCHLPHITLSISVIKQSSETWIWTRSLVNELSIQIIVAASQARAGLITESLYPSPLIRQQAFASILQFESGSISADVDEMDLVMAVSSGNSLFIAQKILHDAIPPEGLPSCAVAHAIGNVGKPGIALLFAPEEPDVREHDVETGGMFEGSSLQMSFTGWVGPLRIRGPSAFRGMEAYNLETQISMYDRGEWVADLNILKALGSSQSPRMARLTGVCIAQSRGFRCFLLPSHRPVCWTCVLDET
ncbi:hypothetical protein BDW59DRAFT_174691 [Aspergillus cavernicola]|uniref:Uncharacterized protein n=1 Tax=Aspergillus cavernicola TaxID=176166 RepID=A0ABR4HXM2_9EURO